MSEESQSISAAEKAFRDLFKDGDTKMQPQAAKEFLKGYFWGYRNSREVLNKSFGNLEKYYVGTALGKLIVGELKRSRDTLISYNIQRMSFLECAKTLGKALGYFMATLDYGILSEHFLFGVFVPQSSPRKYSDIGITEGIMEIITEIVAQLQRINVKVDHTIIRRKISSINKKYKERLTSRKQDFLAKMIAAFM